MGTTQVVPRLGSTQRNRPRTLLELALCVVALCTSCSTSESVPPASVAPELWQYYERFMVDLAVRNLPIKHHVRSIQWSSKLKLPVIGQCEIWESAVGPELYTYRVVKINVDAAEEVLPRLLYHELGHCILGLRHSSNNDDIMSPYVVTVLTTEARDALFEKYASGEDYDID